MEEIKDKKELKTEKPMAPELFWKLQEGVLEKQDIEMLVDFIRTTERFTQFKQVREFEEAWSAWQGCKYSVFVNSGSSANLVMMRLMKQIYGWKDGDEILVPAVTWVTNISPVFQCGLKPVFVDINLEDFSFNYEELEKKITDRARAIFVTHLIGFPADMKRINEIAKKHNLQVMEDCCESHGATINGEKVGNFSAVSSFSFYWGHHMTSVEGGTICTNNPEIYEHSILKRSHGLARELDPVHHNKHREKHPDIDFNFLFLTDGFNFRNTEFNAVLGLSQIKHLDRYIAIRNTNYQQFLEIIAPYGEYLESPYNEGISAFCLPFIVKTKEMKNELQRFLQKEGIESRPVISGNLLRQPFLKEHGKHTDFPNADFLHTNAFYIGNNQFVGHERLSRLKELLNKFFSRI
ncbi:MAG: DegT/DnrJ/EryC1/StrS aminotransferase family protein [Candidatus Liptonbacteria bacterium]